MLTYTIDFFDEVLEDKRGGEPIIRIDGVCGNVLKDHLHGGLLQLEGFNWCSRCEVNNQSLAHEIK